MIRMIFKNEGLFMSFSNCHISCQFTNRLGRTRATFIIPLETVGNDSINTIFRQSIVIVKKSRMPISPRNCLVTTDILPIVFAIWISYSHPENMSRSDCLSSFLDYCVIRNLSLWFEKSADTKVSKTIFTIFRCFSEIMRSSFNVVTVT